MRLKQPVIIAGVAVVGLIAGMTSAPQINVAASDGSVFNGPAYPSAECTSFIAGLNNTFGVVPQQWNSSVGLPVPISGNSARQRIVIPEFDQRPSMPAVNALLRQCGILAEGQPDYPRVESELSAPWIAAQPDLGGEATLDAAIVYSALPPNTDVYIANTAQNNGWYGMFVNAAQACGVVFEIAPLPTDTPATVPVMTKGPEFPAGGCIITASWGGNEEVDFQGVLESNTRAAAVVLERLALLGVMTFISAGDEGAGGCMQGSEVSVDIAALEVASAPLDPPIGDVSFIATVTVTTTDPHKLVVGNDVFLTNLAGPARVSELTAFSEILTVPSETTFTIKQGLSEALVIEPADTSVRGSVTQYLGGVNFGATFSPGFDAQPFALQDGAKIPQFPASHPDVIAVGGTQWLPQADTLANGLTIAYEVGRPYQEFVWKDSNANNNCANAPQTTLFGQEGTGGGQSTVFDMPNYQRSRAQASYGDLGESPKRMLPDLAALAGWPMYAVPATNPAAPGEPTAASYCPEGNFPCSREVFPWRPTTGTSASAPLTAVGFANVNAALTARGLTPIAKGGSNDVHELIYSSANSAAFRDVPEFRGSVPSGNNNLFGTLGGQSMGYSALNGFDMATGMGVPSFSTLANLLIARNTPPTPAPTQTPTPGPTPTPTPAPTATPTPTATPAPVAPAPNPIDAIIADPSAVTAAALAALTPSEVAQIPPAIFGQLPAAAFRGLSAPQARALTTGQVAAIRPARARAIRPAVVRSLRPAQVAVLRPASVRALRPKQVSVLRPAQMRALSTRQVQAMRPKQVRALRPVQVRALTPKQQVIVNRKR